MVKTISEQETGLLKKVIFFGKKLLLLILLILTGFLFIFWIAFSIYSAVASYIDKLQIFVGISTTIFGLFFVLSSYYSLIYIQKLRKGARVNWGIDQLIGIILYLFLIIVLFIIAYKFIPQHVIVYTLSFFMIFPTALNDHPLMKEIVSRTRKNKKTLLGLPALLIFSTFPLTSTITYEIRQNQNLVAFLTNTSMLGLYANFVAILIASYAILTFVYAEINRKSHFQNDYEDAIIKNSNFELVDEFNRVIPLTIYFGLILIIINILANIVPSTFLPTTDFLLLEFIFLQELIIGLFLSVWWVTKLVQMYTYYRKSEI